MQSLLLKDYDPEGKSITARFGSWECPEPSALELPATPTHHGTLVPSPPPYVPDAEEWQTMPCTHCHALI